MCIVHDYDWLRSGPTVLGLVQHRVPLFMSSYIQLSAVRGVGISKRLMLEMLKMPHRQTIVEKREGYFRIWSMWRWDDHLVD